MGRRCFCEKSAVGNAFTWPWDTWQTVIHKHTCTRTLENKQIRHSQTRTNPNWKNNARHMHLQRHKQCYIITKLCIGSSVQPVPTWCMWSVQRIRVPFKEMLFFFLTSFFLFFFFCLVFPWKVSLSSDECRADLNEEKKSQSEDRLRVFTDMARLSRKVKRVLGDY